MVPQMRMHCVKEPGVIHRICVAVCRPGDGVATMRCSCNLALLEKQKIVSEGAGAVAVAAAMLDKLPIKGEEGSMPCLWREYRREHPEAGHKPGDGDIRT